VSGSGISWAICKSAPRSRQITTPVPHHSVFYRLDALPAAQPTPSRHWRQPERRLWLLRIFQFSVHHSALYVSACRLLHVAVVACLDMYRHHHTASPEVDWEHLITDRRRCYPWIIERLHDRLYHAVDVGVWRLVSQQWGVLAVWWFSFHECRVVWLRDISWTYQRFSCLCHISV